MSDLESEVMPISLIAYKFGAGGHPGLGDWLPLRYGPLTSPFRDQHSMEPPDGVEPSRPAFVGPAHNPYAGVYWWVAWDSNPLWSA